MTVSKISVIIPVKNAEHSIGRCLEAVFSQTYVPYEVIVVDGHSSDRTVEIVSKFSARIVSEDYGTIGGARQIGLDNSRSDYVAFTDADCMPEKNWLENLTEAFTENYVGIGGAIENVGKGIWEKSIAFVSNTFLGSANSVQGRMFEENRIVKSISGCNSLYRKKDLLRVGGFNVNLSINEETELNKRLSKVGRLLYTPHAVVKHNQERSLRGFAQRMFSFGGGRGRLRLWDLQCVPPIIALFSVLSLVLTPWILIVVMGTYFLLLIVMGTKTAIRKRNLAFIGSIPAVYLIEHFSYTIGFLMGLLHLSEFKQSLILDGLPANVYNRQYKVRRKVNKDD